MESLCWSYRFRVLARENCFNPCKNAVLSNLGAPICLNYHCSNSRTSGSSVVRSTARDLAVLESPTAKEVLIPFPGSASQPFPHLRLENDHLWSALEIAEAVDGEIVRWGPSGTITTDTRKLMPGQWFFAIAGKNFDGHDFVTQELADKGCVGVIGNRICKHWHGGFIKVEGDTLFGLEKMARYARNRFHGVVVGLTGSVGKTTTRTMIALALESLGRVYQTHGNLNYMVGVALTLTGIPMDAKASVVELGMGGKEGEILVMARMCQPSVRVILNVGHGHMEHFRSLKEVAKAKGEIMTEAKPGDICVLNADDPLVMSIPVPVGVKKVLFGRKIGCDVRLVLAESIDGGCAVRVILESKIGTYHKLFSFPSEKTSEMVEFKIHGPGLHLAMDACAAAAVAVLLGVRLPQIGEALSRFRPVHMRSEMEITKHGIKIINDTYNANLASMMAAIKLLKSMDCEGKRVAILGDMLELGAAEAGAHELALKLCFDACIALVMLAGKRFTAAAEKLNFLGNSNFLCARDSASLVPRIAEMLTTGDVVLVKGSRGMQMEKVVDTIKMMDGR
uniref:UDP-MurNAc-pentapeptide synthetase n=2 Tax=Elaeis guineensis var. tenera TaxID=51953 RepID=A0A6I9QG13_ELAGV|nr:uncharacterized protein LOC105035157 isoform X1 [Elaeis guineensis]